MCSRYRSNPIELSGAITDEDLEQIHAFALRRVPFSNCTPSERDALERYRAQAEAAAFRIAKRSLAALGVNAPFAEK
jgi:hypothetical protein